MCIINHLLYFFLEAIVLLVNLLLMKNHIRYSYLESSHGNGVAVTQLWKDLPYGCPAMHIIRIFFSVCIHCKHLRCNDYIYFTYLFPVV